MKLSSENPLFAVIRNGNSLLIKFVIFISENQIHFKFTDCNGSHGTHSLIKMRKYKATDVPTYLMNCRICMNFCFKGNAKNNF